MSEISDGQISATARLIEKRIDWTGPVRENVLGVARAVLEQYQQSPEWLEMANPRRHIPAELTDRVYQVLQWYSVTGTYMGERTGGVLQGCPRGPKPTPDELVREARKMLQLWDTAIDAAVEGK